MGTREVLGGRGIIKKKTSRLAPPVSSRAKSRDKHGPSPLDHPAQAISRDPERSRGIATPRRRLWRSLGFARDTKIAHQTWSDDEVPCLSLDFARDDIASVR